MTGSGGAYRDPTDGLRIRVVELERECVKLRSARLARWLPRAPKFNVEAFAAGVVVAAFFLLAGVVMLVGSSAPKPVLSLTWSGGDAAGQVNMSPLPADTRVRVSFAEQWTSAPLCFVSNLTAPTAAPRAAAVTAHALSWVVPRSNVEQTFAWLCVGSD